MIGCNRHTSTRTGRSLNVSLKHPHVPELGRELILFWNDFSEERGYLEYLYVCSMKYDLYDVSSRDRIISSQK